MVWSSRRSMAMTVGHSPAGSTPASAATPDLIHPVLITPLQGRPLRRLSQARRGPATLTIAEGDLRSHC